MAFTKEQKTGLIGTLLFHVILLLLFLFFGLTSMIPPPEYGIPINFGTSEDGMGDIQPDESGTPEQNTTEINEVVEETSTPDVSPEKLEEVMTQDVEEAVYVPTAKEIAEKKRKEEEAVKKKKEEEAKKKANKLWNTANNRKNGGSEGETGKTGDQGAIDGDKNAKSHTGGGGGGNGISHNFKNRSFLSIPKIIDNSQDEGKVIVDIVIGRDGKVIKATPGGKGSNTTSPHLYRKAKEAAFKAVFSPNPEAPEEQRGQMTFVFILE